MIPILHKDGRITPGTATCGKDSIAKTNAWGLSSSWMDSVTCEKMKLVSHDCIARDAESLITHTFVDYPLIALHGIEQIIYD